MQTTFDGFSEIEREIVLKWSTAGDQLHSSVVLDQLDYCNIILAYLVLFVRVQFEFKRKVRFKLYIERIVLWKKSHLSRYYSQGRS